MKDTIDIGQYLKYQKVLTDLYARTIEQAALRVGLTKPEADVLLFFANHRECATAAEAVRMRGLSKTAVSKAVEGLAGKGLIRIRSAQKDRRFQHITLEASAAGQIMDLQTAQQEYVRILMRDFSGEEIRFLMKLLERMAENCQSGIKNK